MTANVQQVIEITKELNAHDRALVAHCLISSLEVNQDVGVDQAWAELAEKRLGELSSGKVKAVSWEDIKKCVRE